MKNTLLTIASVIFALLTLSGGGRDAQPLKVMSFNIRYGAAEDGPNSWEFRKEAVFEMINDQQPDIMGLQEALDFQLDAIDANCPDYEYVGVGREDGVSDGEHMAIFWNKKKIKCLDWGTFWLSETPEVPSQGWDGACLRTATWTYLESIETGKKFLYINTHLDHVGMVAQREGLKLVMQRLEDLNDGSMPSIVTGDFNAGEGSPIFEEIDARMKNARNTAAVTDKRYTYNDWRDEETYCAIDYIFYAGFKECSKFERVTQQYAGVKYVSDHYPVTALLHW